MNLFSFLNYFKTEYMNNRQIQIELEETLFELDSYDKWVEFLKNRSIKTRDIYIKNDKMINTLKEYLKEDLTCDSAKAFYDVIHELYMNECDDYAVMSLVIDKLIPYYEDKKDYGKLVKLYHILAFECYEAYGRCGKEEYIIQSTLWYKKVTSYKEHYSEIKDPDERIQIFIAYSNLVAPFGQMEKGTKDIVFDIYDEVLEFFNSDTVQNLDKDNPDFIRHIDQIKSDIFFVDETISKNDKYKDRFFKLVDEYDNEKSDDEGIYFRAKMKADLLRGRIDPKDAAMSITKYIESLPMPNYDNDPEDTLLLILNYHNNMLDLYELITDYIKEDDSIYLKRVLDKVIKVHTTIPYGFYTQMMNNVCEEFYKDIHDIITSYEKKKELLLKLILVRQPTTYIHSMMVAEIATKIARKMIDIKPSYFVGILGISDELAVKNNKDKILDYIEHAGLFHDIGKSFIVEIVNRQQRRLSDAEFNLIKEHPRYGLLLLEYDKDFKDYFDIIIGHHKWYNDLGGYPIDFKKDESDYKFYIDLITISDCMDAATDILGRNYTSGKNFDSLYAELVKDSNIRYNKDIVDFIGNNKELYDELKYLTGEGRASIYYKCYQDILNEK